MKILICKNCGYADESSSDVWKVTRPKPEDDAVLTCPECNGKEFLKLQLSFESSMHLEKKPFKCPGGRKDVKITLVCPIKYTCMIYPRCTESILS